MYCFDYYSVLYNWSEGLNNGVENIIIWLDGNKFGWLMEKEVDIG